jgi:3-hydroxyisobutyrate dehydrogenase-like beta-hydroxyacid dehydrogenase
MVYGCDPRVEQLNALVSAGGKKCASFSQLLQACSTVILSLPDSTVTAELFTQHIDALRRGQTVLDTTTGDPDEMVAISHMIQERGAAYIEANVAGSSAQVRAGDACLLLGGDDAVVSEHRQLLAALASKHFYLGPVGSASRFKLVHNLVLGLHRAVLAEGLSFAEALGFEPAQVLEILQETPAASMVMATKGRKMVTGDRQPQARLSQHLKDVRLILAAAESAGSTTPLSHVHRQLLERAQALGFGDADNSAVIEAYRRGREESV